VKPTRSKSTDPVPEFMVRFCVQSTELTPEEMTRVLGIEPTDVLRAGETNPVRRRVRKTHVWSLELDVDEVGLQEQIDALLELLLPLRERISRVIELGGEPYVRCGYISENLMTSHVLSPDSMATMGGLGIGYSHSHYVSSGQEEPA
jgi:hypothetical protein